MSDHLKSTSKLLSLVLRHRPEEIGIKLDAQGWVDVEMLVERLNATGRRVDRSLLEEVVATSDKQRFAFSADRQRIRANQGHSVEVALDLPKARPPPVLFHGTALQHLLSIQALGLTRGKRQDVHLSSDPDTARKVGARHGKPVVLRIDAERMHSEGHEFRLSENNVWLVSTVPPHYLKVCSENL